MKKVETWPANRSCRPRLREKTAAPLPAGRRAASRPRFPPKIAFDLSLQHPRCVYQLLKKQYERYTPEMVERITGIPQRPIPQGRRPVHLRPQRWRHEKSRHHHLCGRMDAAQLRHADHPHRRRAAIADGQCRPRRWRSQCAPRALQHSGRNRYGGNLRHSPRLFEDAESRRCRSGHLSEAHHANRVQARSVGVI